MIEPFPKRIQLKRTKGWRIPPNTICVDRRGRWGNPFPTHEPARDGHGDIIPGRKIEVRSAQEAVKLYAKWMLPYSHHGAHNTMADFMISQANMTEIQTVLRGKNLACWCKEGEPCHGDWLLSIANEPA